MSVQLGNPSVAAESFHLVRTTSRPFQQVLDSVRKEIDIAGMKVLQEIDPQAALANVGHAIGEARLVFFFHPVLLRRLLGLDWTAIVEAPLKVAVMALPDGTVVLRMANLEVAFARYENPALTAFGRELTASCNQVLDASL